ncbi:MAG: SDR family oxidoreductase [Burkholderiales bacterium]
MAGATGYMGGRLIPELVTRGHAVRALVRPGSEHKLSEGCTPVSGNALDSASYAPKVLPADTFVHLVGTPRPAPWKADRFLFVDLISLRAAITAAQSAAIRHFVYVSVAHPTPLMHAYIRVRVECEASLRASGLNATLLRPWYVIGPRHRWPLLLLPGYWLCERLPATRDAAMRLGLVTLDQMTQALLWAIEHPPQGIHVLDVPTIRGRPRTCERRNVK